MVEDRSKAPPGMAELVGDTYRAARTLAEALALAVRSYAEDAGGTDPELRQKEQRASTDRVHQWTPLLGDLLRYTRAVFVRASAFGRKPVGGMTYTSAHAFVHSVAQEADQFLQAGRVAATMWSAKTLSAETRDRLAAIPDLLESEHERARQLAQGDGR